jgi:predicted nucleotidyltransferase
MQLINTHTMQAFAEKHGLLLVVLFGSQVTAKTHAKSDTDIAFLAAQPKDMRQIAEMHLELSGILKNNNLELVDIIGKSPLFLKQIADQGKVLYEKDPNVFDEFQINAFKRYVEAKPLYALRELALRTFLKTV